MRTGIKKGLLLGMSACLALASLAGCGKKEELDTAAAVVTLDGEETSAGVVNFMLRYEQAQFDSSYGSWLKSYYGDVWNSDLTGSGETYGETFKDQIMTSLERMLLAEKHMEDYGIELTEEEKAAITQAASEFIASNEETVLEKMSATQENVERVLTLRTIQSKVEEEMCADVDTEVSDEEAAQRTVSYVRFAMETEAETAGDETEAETETETGAAVETEAESDKTGSADTEAETEAAETETEAVTEETAGEAETEADTEEMTGEEETEIETETETEDEATREAKAKAKAKAEDFLTQVKEEADFAAAAEEISEADDNVSTSSFTFGDDDTYPDAAIISATTGLEDDTLVDEVVEVGDSYYVLHVDDAFDEEATAEKKDQIVSDRKQEAIDALYEEWTEAVEITVDEEVYGQMIFDLELMIETEAVSEESSEAVTEAESDTEEGSEVVTEAESDTEEGSEVVTEAESDTEEASEAVTEAETEENASEAETEAVTE